MVLLTRVILVLTTALLVAGVVYPLGVFFSVSTGIGAALRTECHDPRFWRALHNTLLLAFGGAAVGTAFSFSASWALWRFDAPAPARRLSELCLKLPYLVPPFFLALGWTILAQPRVYGLGGTALVLTLWLSALGTIQSQGFFRRFPSHWEDAAMLGGAPPWRGFLSITLPLALPQLLATFTSLAAAGLASFAIPALIALPAREPVLTTRIYQAVKSSSGSSEGFTRAAALALVLLSLSIGVTVGAALCQRALQRRLGGALIGGKGATATKLHLSRGKHLLFWGLALLVAALTALPLAAMVWRSFLKDPADMMSFTLARYIYVFTSLPDVLKALMNSAGSASAAALTAVLCAVFAALASARGAKSARLTEVLGAAGTAIPGTVLALSLIVAYAGSPLPGLAVIALAYFAHYYSHAQRTLTPAVQSIGRDLTEAAAMAGASPLRALTSITLPLLKAALSAAFVLSLVPMASEITMSVLLAGGDTEVLGTLMYRLLEYADPGSACVLASCLLGATLAANAVLRRISRGEFGI